MGMFDSIKVDADNICNIAVPKGEFQTYDLDNQCWVFRITKDGKLVVETKATDFGAETGVNWFNANLANPSTILYDVANGKFGGVVSMGGECGLPDGQWVDYLLLIHNSEIQFVTKYGEIVYSADPESNDVFMEVLDKACTPDPLSLKQSAMFQQMMSSKHLLVATSKESDSMSTPQETEMTVYEETGKLPLVLRGNHDVTIRDSYLGDNNKLESRCASHSLMTAEDAPKAMERELQTRKANLLKGMDNGKS